MRRVGYDPELSKMTSAYETPVMAHALEFHGLALEGHHHRGVDDARNMVRLLPFMDWTLEAELLTPPGEGL
jgi:inhibitor of KinA sporulation pathway (predicted exonuclease)